MRKQGVSSFQKFQVPSFLRRKCDRVMDDNIQILVLTYEIQTSYLQKAIFTVVAVVALNLHEYCNSVVFYFPNVRYLL